MSKTLTKTLHLRNKISSFALGQKLKKSFQTLVSKKVFYLFCAVSLSQKQRVMFMGSTRLKLRWEPKVIDVILVARSKFRGRQNILLVFEFPKFIKQPFFEITIF